MLIIDLNWHHHPPLSLGLLFDKFHLVALLLGQGRQEMKLEVRFLSVGRENFTRLKEQTRTQLRKNRVEEISAASIREVEED